MTGGHFFIRRACASLKLLLFDTTDFLYVRKTRFFACFCMPLQGRKGDALNGKASSPLRIKIPARH